jgi:hypothetical protein
MVERSELARRWAPTLHQPRPVEPLIEVPTTVITDTITQARAFVTNTPDKTVISGPASTFVPTQIAESAAGMPGLTDILNRHMMWMHGRFVGADRANRNGAYWSAGDLELAQKTVAAGPLNWLHEERHIIGTIADAAFVRPDPPVGEAAASEPIHDPHITADAAVWRWIWPDEAYVIEQASGMNKLWYSMECISEQVECSGDSGCGSTTSYGDYLAGKTCAHITERSSVRRFVNPVFLGGAVIVPPVEPGWSDANASLMSEAAALAPETYEQAGQPADISSSEWEQLMATVLRYART